MKSVFVTGGTGFIGQYLLRNLISQHWQVYLLCRRGSEYKIPKRILNKIHIVYGELCNRKTYEYILQNTDYVLHFAALFKLEAKEEDLRKLNVEGTNEILKSCVNKKNIKRIIYCSTAGVYEYTNKIIDENHPVATFSDLHRYERSKIDAERICFHYIKEHNLPIIVIRPTGVYGKGSHYLFSTIFSLIKDGKIKFYFGTGDNLLHLVHVEDVARSTIHLLKHGKVGEIYNICDDTPITMKQALDYVLEGLNMQKPRVSIPLFVAELLLPFAGVSKEMFQQMKDHRHFSNKKIKNTGFKFKYPDFRKGLKEYITDSWAN